MLDRESQSLAISRQTLLVVTGVTVGLLTLSYVLGVQVGKQSAALRKSVASKSGKDLDVLPIPLAEQLQMLEKENQPRPAHASQPPPSPSKPESPKPEAKPTPAPTSAKPEEGGKWTWQVLSTSDHAEAQRAVTRLGQAGFQATIVKDAGAFKVRLAKPGPREAITAAGERLKAKGFKPFPVKVA